MEGVILRKQMYRGCRRGAYIYKERGEKIKNEREEEKKVEE